MTWLDWPPLIIIAAGAVVVAVWAVRKPKPIALDEWGNTKPEEKTE